MHKRNHSKSVTLIGHDQTALREFRVVFGERGEAIGRRSTLVRRRLTVRQRRKFWGVIGYFEGDLGSFGVLGFVQGGVF